MLFLRGIKKHRGTLLGIGILLFLTMLSLCTVLTFYLEGNAYISTEIRRSGFGDLTAWVSEVPDVEALAESIREQEPVDQVQIQNVIYAEYEANGVESDSEGQLIPWSAEDGRYRFFQEDLSGYQSSPDQIGQGQVYVSPAMESIANIKVGDAIRFSVARSGVDVELTVAGYYEDPFMGSSMIGMKGFLISQETYDRILTVAQEEGADALARSGAMLHIVAEEAGGASIDQINQLLNAETALAQYTEFIHSANAIKGFMTILQNAFCGILSAFAAVLFLVVLVVLGHGISGTVEQEWENLGILKTLGFTGKKLAALYGAQYLAAAMLGAGLGCVMAGPLAGILNRMTVTTTGVLIPTSVPALPCAEVLAVILFLVWTYAQFRLRKIRFLKPIEAIRRESGKDRGRKWSRIPEIKMRGLAFFLALRQLASGKKRYLGACLVAAMLVFFASLTGRINDWLGPDGKGMMDAFNPADLDLGVQVTGRQSAEEVERMVGSYSEITDSYLLAMPSVSINGSNYTANVITDPERFHISRGETSRQEDKVVLTESLAQDLGAEIGDAVMIQGDMGSREFTVSGIYHCANDMGANLGMSREGYLSIGQDDPRIWCHHYFLADPSQKQAITQALEAAYGGDVHVHENSWPGLFGIISAMHLLLAFMYAMVAVFILLVTWMSAGRLLTAERKDLGIYRSIGCSAGLLRVSFAIRFAAASLLGAIAGTLGAVFLTDPLVSGIMRLAGISNFASHPAVGNVLLPGAAVSGLFFGFAWLLAGNVRKTDMSVLTVE